MRMVCELAGIDAEAIFPLVQESAEACWNKKYGTKDMGPFSGSCLPKDTSGFLTWAQQEYAAPMTLLQAVIDVNEQLKSKLSEPERTYLAEAEVVGQHAI